MTSYIQLLNKIEAFCLAHKQIQKYGGEFREQMPNFSTKDTKYPMVFVSPSNGAPLYDTNEITLDIYCVDIIQKGRENLNTIVSDCHLILTDLYIYFSQGSDLTIDVLGTPSQTPLNNLDLDYVAGWMMTITFQVEGWCVAAIPMGDIPSGQGCEDATYIVEYEDGTPIETGTIASGATKTIEVPNCPACEDATAELYFEDELIDTITVPCGDTGSIEIGCSTLMNAVKVVSTWQQHKHGGTFKHIGEENGKPKYEALHDPTKTIVYDGTKWQIIKTAPDAHVHNAANGNEAFPWLATWLDDYLTVTQATVGSFCTNGGIAYYNLVDTDGNLLAEGSISEGDEDNIVAPDATYSNSDNSYSGSVLSGGSLSLPDITVTDSDGSTFTSPSVKNITCTPAAAATVENSDSSYSTTVASGGTLTLPDSQINVNGVDEGDVVSVKTIDVNITDGTNPVTPDAVSLSGNILTVQVPSGGAAPVGATLMKTGQTTSYRTGDDGDLEEGRATDFFTLSTNNPYGNTTRFLDTAGGTTFADDIVIDWSTYDNVAGTVLGYYLGDASNRNWNDYIDWGSALSIGTFTTGWRSINVKEMTNLWQYSTNRATNYSPFDGGFFTLNIATSSRFFWTSTTYPTTTANAIRVDLASWAIQSTAKTNSNQCIAVRTFTVTGTTLS